MTQLPHFWACIQTKIIIQKGTGTSTFIAALFTTANTCETTPRPTNRGMDEEDVVHIDNGILLSHKKE